MQTNDSTNQPGRGNTPVSDDALERFLAGRCAPAERVVVEEWLDAHPQRRSVGRAIGNQLAAPAPRFDVDAMLTRARVRMDDADHREASVLQRVSRQPMALAAAVLVVVAAATTFVRATRWDSAPIAANAAGREVVAAPGRQAIVDLADGSHVILAPGSTLRIPADFNIRGPDGILRPLDLEGKAHFRVEHDPARPFIVRTSTAITEDVGTEFVVRAYPENRSTEVAVFSGAVALHRPRQAGAITRTDNSTRSSETPPPLVVLSAGDVGELDSGGTVTVARNVNTARHLTWTTGVLTLDAAPLKGALAELSRWYDVEFVVEARELDSLRLSGEFRSESVGVAMQRLGLMLGVRAALNGRTVVLSPAR